MAISKKTSGTTILADRYLRLISGDERIVIAPTSGKRVIAYVKDVFGHIDYNFRNWEADQEGEPTKETLVQVYEMVNSATFAQIFDKLDKVVLTQDQIIEFVEKHRSWLGKDGYAATLFFI